MYSLQQIAEALGAKLVGDGLRQVDGIAALDLAGSTQLSFLSNPRYRKALQTTTAGAVLVREAQLDDCTVDALVVDDPYLAYAKISSWFLRPARQFRRRFQSVPRSIQRLSWVPRCRLHPGW